MPVSHVHSLCRCTKCGGKLVRSTSTARRPYRHITNGLARASLIGIEFEHCPTHGLQYTSVTAMGRLLAAMGKKLMARLGHDGVRFVMGLTDTSAVKMAAALGMTPRQFNRWRKSLPPAAPMRVRRRGKRWS